MHWRSVRLTALLIASLSGTVLVAMHPEETRTTMRRYARLVAGTAGEGVDSVVAMTPVAPRAASPRTAAAVQSASSSDYYKVPIGTVVSAKLRTPIDSSTSQVNEQIDAELTEAVAQNGVELIPAGSLVHGTLVEVEPASRKTPLGRAAIAFAVVQHAESRSRAPFRTRPLAFEAQPPVDPPAARRGAKRQPIDLVLPAGHPLRLTLDAPIVVAIPGKPRRSAQDATQ
jgi:hypothetical protein